MTMDCLEKTWREAGRPMELEHTTPYIWENPDKFSIGQRWRGKPVKIIPCRTDSTIDYEADYLFIKRVFEALYPVKRNFSCSDILTLTSQQPEIYNINAAYAGVNWYRNHLNELKTITPDKQILLLVK